MNSLAKNGPLESFRILRHAVSMRCMSLRTKNLSRQSNRPIWGRSALIFIGHCLCSAKKSTMHFSTKAARLSAQGHVSDLNLKLRILFGKIFYDRQRFPYDKRVSFRAGAAWTLQKGNSTRWRIFGKALFEVRTFRTSVEGNGFSVNLMPKACNTN